MTAEIEIQEQRAKRREARAERKERALREERPDHADRGSVSRKMRGMRGQLKDTKNHQRGKKQFEVFLGGLHNEQCSFYDPIKKNKVAFCKFGALVIPKKMY